MPYPETSENEKGCVCSDWAEHFPQLKRLLLPATHRSDDPAESLWSSLRFCPWCGRLLAGVPGRRDEIRWEQCRQRIEESFFAEDDWGAPQTPNMLAAARAITDYRQETGDVLGTLELMLTFVETGTRFTLKFGDIDEPFYEGLELMLDDFRDLLLAHPHLYEEGELAQRLAKLARDAGWLGWGYGDYVTEQVAAIRQRFADV